MQQPLNTYFLFCFPDLKMKYRAFGNTDLKVSEIGFGAWAIGGGAMIGETAIGWGSTDDRESISAINKALDAGINFFDTADIYGLGHSEELLGKTIGKQKDIIIATKGGNVSRNNQFTTDYSAAHLISACENSLRRLKRDCIDYYQLHTARMIHLEGNECIKAMENLQKQGKIRYWGLSLNTFDPLPEAEYLVKNKKGNGFQLVLNLINQRALPLMKQAKENDYGLIARMPLQFGLLTGKFDQQAAFEKNDHRNNRLTMDVIGKTNEVLQPAWDLCRKYDCNKTSLALSYILSHPEVSVVIPGIRTASQVLQNTAGLFQLEPADMLLIEEDLKDRISKLMDRIQERG